MQTIIKAIGDNKLLPGFAEPSWWPWHVFLKGVFGLDMSAEELKVFRRHTGRHRAPTKPFKEIYCIAGRRSGKTRTSALVATYLACFSDFSTVLSPGENGVVMCISQDRRQSRVIFRYISALIDSSPMLHSLVVDRTKESIALNNGIVIECHTSNFRAVRGYTVCAAICDELAFWRSDESANPDREILAALRPAMATVPQSLLLCISSPYARRGSLWDAYRTQFGKDDSPVLVWQAASRDMNATISQGLVEEALAADEAAAKSEWLAEFRRDIESFVSIETIESCVVPGRHQLPPVANQHYVGFVDPSGGSRDSMTMAVAHHEHGKNGESLILDLLLERKPPFSPENVVKEFAKTLREYRVTVVQGDRYAGQWPREQFQKCGITYRPSQLSKSELYQDLLALLNSGKIELLDSPRLKAQLVGLERRVARSGRDTIDHSPGAYDDAANAVAGALLLANKVTARYDVFPSIGLGERSTRSDDHRCAECDPYGTWELPSEIGRGW